VDFYQQQARNRRYTALLIACFVLFFAAVGLSLDLAYLGGFACGFVPVVATTALAFSCLLSVLAYYRGGNLVMGSLLARPLRIEDPEHRELHNVVNEMALASGLPRPRVFVIPDPSPNALATGRGPEHAAIAVTEGALALLDREETQGVVAHEMAHIRNRDTLVMTLVAVLFGGIVMLADWGRRSLYVARRGRGGHPLLALLAVLLVAVSPLLSRLLALAVSRRREYLADATAVEFTRNPEGLARALEKIERVDSPLRGASRGTAHLFIVNPLKRRSDEREGALADLLSSHPPLRARIDVLRGMARP
jgi:heat shock protein HtpX